MFFPALLSISIIGNIKKVAANEIMNPIQVFETASNNDCFLLCIIYFLRSEIKVVTANPIKNITQATAKPSILKIGSYIALYVSIKNTTLIIDIVAKNICAFIVYSLIN